MYVYTLFVPVCQELLCFHAADEEPSGGMEGSSSLGYKLLSSFDREHRHLTVYCGKTSFRGNEVVSSGSSGPTSFYPSSRRPSAYRATDKPEPETRPG